MTHDTEDPREEDRRCYLTDQPVRNDCFTKIAFGYGSDLNRHTYRFVMCDEIGQKVLKYIESLYTNGKTPQDHVIVDKRMYD